MASPYLDRIELALPPRFFLELAREMSRLKCASRSERLFAASVMAPLSAAVRKALRGDDRSIPPGLDAALSTLTDAILLPYQRWSRAGAIAVLVHLVSGLVEEGLLCSGDGPLANAMQAFADLVNQHPDVAEAVDGAARHNARVMRQFLARHGLYVPARIMEAAE